MTYSATRFVTPLTFRSITHRPVLVDLFDPDSPEAIEHVALAQAAHILVVAPATAHMLAKLALGLADDPISVTALATGAPLLIAPAMDASMWEHPAVQQNVNTLVERGATIVGPGEGRLASGLTGWGRLAETPELLGRIAQTLGANGDLRGRSIVVSAGGTQEPLDPCACSPTAPPARWATPSRKPHGTVCGRNARDRTCRDQTTRRCAHRASRDRGADA